MTTNAFDFSDISNVFGGETLFASPGVIPAGKDWFIPTLQRILALTFDTDNWSTEAKRTDQVAAEQLLKVLLQILPDEAPAPTIVPTWLGGTQAEWHRNGIDLEISVNPGEMIEYYCSNGCDEFEGTAFDDLPKLKEYAVLIV